MREHPAFQPNGSSSDASVSFATGLHICACQGVALSDTLGTAGADRCLGRQAGRQAGDRLLPQTPSRLQPAAADAAHLSLNSAGSHFNHQVFGTWSRSIATRLSHWHCTSTRLVASRFHLHCTQPLRVVCSEISPSVTLLQLLPVGTHQNRPNLRF